MKSYLIISLIFFSSIGLSSCRQKNEISQEVDTKIGEPNNMEASEHDIVARAATLRVNPLRLGKVYYFQDILKRHTHDHEAFSEITDETVYPQVIIDFYAPWCGPCKTLSDVLHNLAPKHPSILIVKIDIEQFPTIAQEFDVRTLPTLLFFRNGSMVKRIKGFNKKELLQTIGSLFSK